MLKSTIIKERLELTIGNELSLELLHGVLFGDNERATRRFKEGIDSYVVYSLRKTPEGNFAKMHIKGNDDIFVFGINDKGIITNVNKR